MSARRGKREDRSVIFASNRGPLSFVEAGGEYAPAPGIGAVAELLDLLARSSHRDSMWIAAAVSDEDHAAARNGDAKRAAAALPYATELLTGSREAFRGYYDAIGNRVLWFACHDLWREVNLAPAADRAWQLHLRQYDEVNRLFARSLAAVGDDESLVLLHDYHLLTAARHLRALRPHWPIGLFVHTAWSAAGFRVLPRALTKTLVRGMAAADVIGFHVDLWVDEFLATCEDVGIVVDRPNRTISVQGGETRVRAFPGAIDVSAVAARATTPRADAWARDLRAAADGPLIVRTERIEPSKNTLRGFEAYEALLRAADPAALEATFVASLLPRRAAMDEYQAYRTSVEGAISRIEARTPGRVRLLVGDDHERSLAALRVADVTLVNSLRDGMNVVAKEAALLNERNGVLVITATTGAAAELGGAAIVIDDPEDVAETAAALHRALTLPRPERMERSVALREVVTSRAPVDWLEEQVDALVSAGARRAAAVM